MTKKKKITHNTYVLIAIIIGLSILGYALISRQTKLDMIVEQNRIETDATQRQEEREEEKEASREKALSACLATAERGYNSSWNANCKDFGSYLERDEDGEIENCALPGYLRDDFSENKQKEKDRCTELYGN